MRNIVARLVLMYCCCFLMLYDLPIVYSEPTLDEIRQLLQKGLTIYEIDQELERLTRKEKELAKDITAVEKKIEEQMVLVDQTKEKAGKILRSYYIGERDTWIQLFFSTKNFSDALTVWEYVSIMFKSDRQILDRHMASYRQLKASYEELTAIQAEIRYIKEEFLRQRNTLVALQEELDQELENHPDAKLIEEWIQDLTQYWKDVGLPLFERYFKALSQAMNELPEITATHKNVIRLRGRNVQFQLTDEQLNDFLRSKNEIFENFAFEFQDNMIEIRGKEGEIEATIRGTYTLETEPVNVIRFHVSELIFDGYTLPDTTIRALEEQFDLGFYPETFQFLGFRLEATDVLTESGKLTVQLKIN